MTAPTDERGPAGDLADVLARDREAILDAWTEVLLSSPHDHYRRREPAELRSWLTESLDAVRASLASGSSQPLVDQGRRLGEARHRLGFEIDEVLDGLLRGCDAMLPSILTALRTEPVRLTAAVAAAESAMRRLTCSFGQVFAQAARRQEQRMAVLEERQRLARDLHDSVTQSLYAATLYAGAMARLLESGQVDSARHHLADLRATTRQALREMRLLVFELRPSILPREGLEAALTARLAAVEGRAGVETSLECRGLDELPLALTEALYGIAREALNNTLKHAAASRIEITVRAGRGTVELAVSDDGSGFDPAGHTPDGGLGLAGMRERAHGLSGRLEIDTAPGRGTVVRAVLPVPDLEVDVPGNQEDQEELDNA